MRRQRNRLSRTFVLNSVSLGLAMCAVVLALGFLQSDTEPRWSQCIVDESPQKILVGGAKKWSSKRLFCEHNKVVIALKKDQELPLTKDEVLKHNTAVACTYEVARNPFYLFQDQVLIDSVECQSNTSTDTG